VHAICLEDCIAGRFMGTFVDQGDLLHLNIGGDGKNVELCAIAAIVSWAADAK
jgi:hypothetical protein